MPSPRRRRTRGAQAGARLTDARALDPALIAVPADPAGDAALVERLARWAGRWSPLVEVDGDRGCGSTSRGRASVRRRGGLVDDVPALLRAAGADGARGDRADRCGCLGAGASVRPVHLRRGYRARSWRRCLSALRLDPDTVRRSNGWASRPSAPAGMPRLALARPVSVGRKMWSMRSTARWAASRSR